MGNAGNHHHINYIEFTVSDMARAIQFYSSAFGWSFTEYGPDYASFDNNQAGIDGGIRKGQPASGEGAPLVILYSASLKATEDAIVAAGGTIVVPTFEFPGGRRFHFSDGCGTLLGVWSE